MKKFFLFLATVILTIFSTITIADTLDDSKNSTISTIQEINKTNINTSNSTAQLFQIESAENQNISQKALDNIKVMSESDMKETQGGVTGPYVCAECGGRHGGVYSPNYCQYCYIKLQ